MGGGGVWEGGGGGVGVVFFFNDTATTEIYTLSLHDALPIWSVIYFSKRSKAYSGLTLPSNQISIGVSSRLAHSNMDAS